MRIRPFRPFGDHWVYKDYATGGMSVVYLAFDPGHSRLVALKTLLEELWDEEDYRARFAREVAIHSQLHHPHVVRYLDGRADEQGCYLATEFVRGRPLDVILEEHPSGLPIPRVVRIMEALTAALFHIHSKGVIHRDLQPRNVVIDDSGGIRLFDFGIARCPDLLIRTRTGTVMGTFSYSSPEQNQGRPVDERADLYSLGLLLYELLTGQRAIQGSSLLDITEFQLRAEVPPPGVLRHEVPTGLSELIASLTRRWPEERPATARHLLDAMIHLKATADESERALLSPSPIQAGLDVARRVLHNGRPEQALARIDRALCESPEDGPAHLLRAGVLTELGRAEDARRSFRIAAEAMSDVTDVHIDHALALHRLGLLDEASDLAEDVLARDEGNAFASCYLAYRRASKVLGTSPPPETEDLPAPSLELDQDQELAPITEVRSPAPDRPREPPSGPPAAVTSTVPSPAPAFAPPPVVYPVAATGSAVAPGPPEPSEPPAPPMTQEQAPAPDTAPAPAEEAGLRVPELLEAATATMVDDQAALQRRRPSPIRAAHAPPAGSVSTPGSGVRPDGEGERLRKAHEAWCAALRDRDEDVAASLATVLPGSGELYLGARRTGLLRLFTVLALMLLAVAVLLVPVRDGLSLDTWLEQSLRRDLVEAARRHSLVQRLAIQLELRLAPLRFVLLLVISVPLALLWRGGRAAVLRRARRSRGELQLCRVSGDLLEAEGFQVLRGEAFAVMRAGPGRRTEWMGDAVALADSDGSTPLRFYPRGANSISDTRALLLPRGALEASPLLPPASLAVRIGWALR